MRVVESPSRELFKKKAEVIYSEAVAEYLAAPLKGPYELLLSMLKGVDRFFGTLRKPFISREMLLTNGDIPTRTSAKKFYTDIVNDLKIAFAEQDAIADNIVATVNYGQSLKGAVSGELGRLRSITDAAMASSITTASTTVVFEDNFSTTKYVNIETAPTVGTLANVDTMAGALTLHKEKSETTIKDGSEIEILSYSVSPAKPGGGQIKELLSHVYAGASNGITGASPSAPITQNSIDDAVRPNIRKVMEDKSAVYLDALKLMDNSLTSIWETELVVLEREKNTQIGDDMFFTSTGAETLLGYRPKRLQLTKEFISSTLSSNPDSSIIRYIWGTPFLDPSTVTLQMSMKIQLKAAARVGEIRIYPTGFGKTCPAKVTSIRVIDSTSGSTPEVDLTSSVGITDSSGYLTDVLSYVLGNINVTTISIDFEQRQSYPIKYELGVFKSEVRRQFFGDTYLKRSALFFVDVQGKELMENLEKAIGTPLRGRELKRQSPVVRATWVNEQTDQLRQSLAPGVMKATCKAKGGTITSIYEKGRKLPDNKMEYLTGAIGEPTVVVIPSSMSNKRRFAIGIEDIVLSTVIFSEVSEIDTLAWQSPYPIGSVSLSTTELVPTEFLTATQDAWITYFLSFDEGKTFYQIAPIGNTPIYKGEYQVPTIIRVNSDVPKERYSIYPWGPHGFVTTTSSPRTIVMKMRLRRPPDSAGGEFSGFTPRLDKYRLTIEPVAVGGSL